MADRVKVRTLERIDDPKGRADIKANVEVELPRKVAERLIREGKAEKVNEK